MKPLLVMAGLGAMALRDPERRKKAISMARDGATQVKARLSKQEKPDSGYDPPPAGRGYSATSTVGRRRVLGPRRRRQRSGRLRPPLWRQGSERPAKRRSCAR